MGFFGENRLAGGRFYSFGVAGDLIFSLASTVLEIFKKNWNAVYSFLSHWKTVRTRYTHSLRSCVALGSIKKAPEGGGWAYSQAGASVHWLDASVHGLPEIFVQ